MEGVPLSDKNALEKVDFRKVIRKPQHLSVISKLSETQLRTPCEVCKILFENALADEHRRLMIEENKKTI